MVDTTMLEKWETPLHAQWADLNVQAVIDSLNYSSGGALGFIYLRGVAGDAAFTQEVAAVLGGNIPTQPKQTAYTQQAAILWLSPDEWLLVCSYAEKNTLLHKLQDALKGVYAQVVDNSGGFMLMRINGTEATTVLRHISPYNFEALQTGQCVQTVAKKTTVVVVKVAENDCAFIFRRSFADYLWRILQKTAKPYSYALQKEWQFEDADWQRYTA